MIERAVRAITRAPSGVRAITMPAKAPPTFPASKQEGGSLFARWTEALENWLYRQRLKDREAYVAQSQDIFEVERRVRELDRHAYF